MRPRMGSRPGDDPGISKCANSFLPNLTQAYAASQLYLPGVSQIHAENLKLEVLVEHLGCRAVRGPPCPLGALALR